MSKEGPVAAGLKKPLALALLIAWTATVLALSFPAWEATLGSSLLTKKGIAAAVAMIAAPSGPGAGVFYALLHHGTNACMVLALHATMAGAGQGFIRWLVPGSSPGWLFAWGAGFGVINLLGLGMGLIGLFAPAPVLAASLGLAAGGAWEYATAVGKNKVRLKNVRGSSQRGFLERAFLYAAVLAAGLLALLAVSPDTSWDAVVYHLRVPAFFIHEHRIFHMPTHHFTAFPLACEMLFSWLMLLSGLDFGGGGAAPRLFHLSCAIVAALCAGRIGKRLAGPAGGALAGLLLLISPFTGAIAIRAYNDFAQAALAGLVLVLALERPKGYARLAGFLAGVAVSAKYTAVLFFVPLAVFWLKFNWRPYLAWTLAFLPWIAKNYLMTGNPAAPFLCGLFPASPETQHQLVSYLRSVAGMTLNPSALGYGAMELLRGHAGESLTELLPVLVAAAALLPFRGGATAGLWRFTVLFAGLWAGFSPAIRFFTPALVPLCALAARGYFQAEAFFGALWLRVAAGIFIAANLARLPVAHCQLFDPAAFILGKQTTSEYVTDRLYPIPFYGPSAEWINSNLPADARLLCMLDIKAHYIWRRVYHDFQYVQPGIFLRWLREGAGTEGLLRKLKQEGISHLLVVQQRARDVGRHYSWQGRELAQAAEFLASHTRSLVGNTEIEVLAVSDRARARRDVSGYGWMLFMHPENLIVEGRDLEAAELLETTMAAAPWLPGTKALLGLAYARLGRLADAERLLIPAAGESGEPAARAALVLGQVMLIQGRNSEAEKALRRSLSLNPDLPDAHFALGMLLHEQGKKDEGRRHLKRAVELDPGNRNWAQWLATVSSP